MIAGYVIGSGAGFLVAILVDRVPFLRRGLLPIGNLVSALPIIGVAPIMVMWFGFDWPSKAAVVVIMTFFPMLVNTVAGLSASDHMQRDLMRTYAANYWQNLVKLRLPAALPFIFNGSARAAKPLRRSKRQQREQHQRDKLRNRERRLGLIGGRLVQDGNLQKRLHDQHEEVEVQRHRGAHRVDRTPNAGQPARVAGHDGDRQHHERNNPNHDPRRYAVIGKKDKARDARCHGADQKDRRPTVQAPGGQ